MKNVIRSNGKIWKRKSKNLKSGEINCLRCGAWVRIIKLTDKHFNNEYFCRTCRKELNEIQKKTAPTEVSGKTPKIRKAEFPEDCPHRAFFWCKTPNKCRGCYYNPTKKEALWDNDDDSKKTAKTNWFYGSKKHSKKCLKLLEDIKHGRGLHKGGTRHYFRYARKSENEE